MVRSAIDKGFQEIGFAEHLPYPEGFESDVPGCVVPVEAWPQYLADVRAAQERFRQRIVIRLGAEIDYLPGYESELASRLQGNAYDVVFGSVHLVDGVMVDFAADYLEERLPLLGGPGGLWKTYWDRLEGLIRSGLCDVVSHLDLPRKLGGDFPEAVDWERLDAILDLIRDAGLTMEVNTGGIDRSALREAYPADRILRMASGKGIDILIGSDAHDPEQIGRYFRETAARLAALGWRHLTLFEKRGKTFLPISRWL
jgi:histidinol-phosphatase (PHP family)